MKIIVLMPIESPWSRNFVFQLIKLGHEVYVVDSGQKNSMGNYLSKQDLFQRENIRLFSKSVEKIFIVQSNLGYLFNLVKRIFIIRNIARKYRTEAILSLYGGRWGLTAYLARLKPFFVYIVGSDILLSTRVKRIITRKVLQSADLVFSNGINLGERANEIAPGANIENLYLGIDTSKYCASMVPFQDNQQNFPHSQVSCIEGDTETITRKIMIICTRGFENIYNNQYLIDGLKEIPTEGLPEFKIIFTSVGSLLEDVKKHADNVLNQKQRERLEFLGGVTEEVLLKYLKESKIYISLSKSDGASISLMEAFSCGLFPILSDIPANHEWIVENNGIVVPFDKPKILAQAIIQAIQDSEWRSRAAKINREMILQKADSSKNIQCFDNKVKSIIDEYITKSEK